MMDTTELGAGSYPEPPEPKEKLYKFEFRGLAEGYGYVYAEDEFSASLKASQQDYDSIEDIQLIEVEEITRVEED
jgi:hypothetical protein